MFITTGFSINFFFRMISMMRFDNGMKNRVWQSVKNEQ